MTGTHKPGRMTKQEQLRFDEFVIDCYNNDVPADILIESGFNKNSVYSKYEKLEKEKKETIKKNYELRVLENREKQMRACDYQVFKTLSMLSSIDRQIQNCGNGEVPAILYQQWVSISKILLDLRKEKRSYYEDVTEEDIHEIVQDEIIAYETKKKEMQKNQKPIQVDAPTESKIDGSNLPKPEPSQEVNSLPQVEMRENGEYR